MNTRLKDGGVYIDWTGLTDIKVWLWSESQKAIAGRCDFEIDEADGTKLLCRYSASKPQYPGLNKIIVQATYMGGTKTFDKTVFNFVRWTADQAGEQITIDDPEVDVEIVAEDISSSVINEAVRAALDAADEALAAKAAVEATEAAVEGAEAARVAAESARETAEKIRETEDPDYLICVYHGGFEKDPVTGEILSETDENEGFRMLTSIPEIDILITGHQHRKYCGVFRRAEGAGTAGAGPGACPEGTQGEDSAGPVDKASGIIYTQTRDNGVELSCIEIDAETGMICARILPADAEPDQELLLAAEREEKDCQNWLDQPLGRSETDLRVIDEFDGRLHKSQLITFLNRVQMEISGAQLAGSALFRGACGFGKEITMRDLVSTYSFPNTLAVKLVSGKVLKAYLEKCAEFWALNGDRIVVSERFEKPVPMYFNYDMVDGVSYTIDVSRPVGSRIVRLETAAAAEQKDSGSAGFGTAQNGSGNGTVQQGCTVTDDMEFTLAVNNYRAAGGGGFDMLRDAPTIREIPMSMVDLLAEYIMKHKRIRFEPVENIIVTAHTT